MKDILNDAFKEAGKRNKCDDGGYDLWKIEAFVSGAKVAISDASGLKNIL